MPRGRQKKVQFDFRARKRAREVEPRKRPPTIIEK